MKLNKKNILSPFQYKCKQGLIKENKERKVLWNAKTIANILENPVYQGDIAQKRNQQSQILVKNTQEPLIKRQEFKAVQEKRKEGK